MPVRDFTVEERRLISRLRTPRLVQRFLNELPYNHPPREADRTLRSFRGVVRHGTAHCLEAALAATVILEQHGYPPLVLSFDSADNLGHVLFVYRRGGRWGAVGRSRDPGLHGRRPVFGNVRSLVLSYFDAYVDLTGCLTGYAVVNLKEALGSYDWRLSERNVWKVERLLIETPHRRLRVDRQRVKRLRAGYRAFLARYPGRKPLDYRGRETWSELPAVYRAPGYLVRFPETRAGRTSHARQI
jgi:hypothetical protein